RRFPRASPGRWPAPPRRPGSAPTPKRAAPGRPRTRQAAPRRRVSSRAVRGSAAARRAGTRRRTRRSSRPSGEPPDLVGEARERHLVLRARLQLLQPGAIGLELLVAQDQREPGSQGVGALQLVAGIRLAEADLRG